MAKALERHEDVAAALAAGDLRVDQAQVIVDAVEALPADVPSSVSANATQFLLEQAGEHDAKALRALGRRVLEVVDPAAADVEEARRLEAEEDDARTRASFTKHHRLVHDAAFQHSLDKHGQVLFSRRT